MSMAFYSAAFTDFPFPTSEQTTNIFLFSCDTPMLVIRHRHPILPVCGFDASMGAGTRQELYILKLHVLFIIVVFCGLLDLDFLGGPIV